MGIKFFFKFYFIWFPKTKKKKRKKKKRKKKKIFFSQPFHSLLFKLLNKGIAFSISLELSK